MCPPTALLFVIGHAAHQHRWVGSAGNCLDEGFRADRHRCRGRFRPCPLARLYASDRWPCGRPRVDHCSVQRVRRATGITCHIPNIGLSASSSLKHCWKERVTASCSRPKPAMARNLASRLDRLERLAAELLKGDQSPIYVTSLESVAEADIAR